MAANETLKSPSSLPRDKGPLGQNVSSLPLTGSHREEHRIRTNLNTHSGDEILKYMQSEVSSNTGNDEARESQVTSSIASIQNAIAEMLTNIRASTSQSEKSSEKSVTNDDSKTRASEDQTSEGCKAKATDSEHTSDKGNKIKRPMNAFMVWAREYRQVLSKGFPKESNSQISVRLGDIWSNLTSEEKQPFYDKADRLRRQHEKDYPDWVYQPNKRRRISGSFPQTENRVVMATAGQFRGVLNSGNLGQFQVQIRPSIKAGQVQQPTKNLQVNSGQVLRKLSTLPQTTTQQVKSVNTSQSQPVSTSGSIHSAGPQFQSPKHPAIVSVDESPLAADKFHSLLSRYPMASVLGKLSPEPRKKRSKSTFKQCKKQQSLKAKTPQRTKTRKKGKKPSPEKAPSKKVGNIRPSLPEPTKQAQQSWNCSGVPIGGVQTVVYSPYPTAAAGVQLQNHTIPLVHQGQPIVQIPTPSQFVTTPPTGFMNMQRLPQQPTPPTFYHGNMMGPVAVVHRFPDPLAVRPDYSQPPPPLALPVQPGVMYPTRPLLPIMQDCKPGPHFPGQVVTFGPRLNISNNKNNSNSAGISAHNVINTTTNKGNDTSSVNNEQKLFSNTTNDTTNVSSNTNESKLSNIKATSSNIIYTNTNINANTSSCNKAQNVFDNAINNTTNGSNNNNRNKSKLRSNNANSSNITNTATHIKSDTSCSKNEQNFFNNTVNNTVNSTTNLINSNTDNIKANNESTNSSNIIYTNTNINGNVNNISSNNAQQAFTNIAIGNVNTSRNKFQNVFSNTVNGKINLSTNTNNNNRSNSSNSHSYWINSINNARNVFKNTVNSTTNVSNNCTNSSSSNNTVNSTAKANSNSTNSSSQQIDNLNTVSNTNNSNVNIIDTSNKKASNKNNTDSNFININMASQSHNTVNCVLDENNNKIITNNGDNITMLFKAQNGVTAQSSGVYTAAKQTCNQSDNWMLQPPANPSTVYTDWNLNSQEKDEKFNIIVKLKHEDEPAVVQKHYSSQTTENPAVTEFSKPSENSACLAPLPPKKSFLHTLNTPMSSTDVVNQLTKLIRPPSLPYGATKKGPAPQARDDSPEKMYKQPVGVPTDNSCDSVNSTKLPEPCPAGSSARIPAQSSCQTTRLTQTSNLLKSETFPSREQNFVSNNKEEKFLSTIDHGNSVFQLTDYQSVTKKTQDSDPRPPEMKFSVPSSTSVAVLSSPNVAVCQQRGIIYINDSFSPVSQKKDGIPQHLLQTSYSSSSSDSSFQLPDHMKPIDLSIVSIDSDNSIPEGCEKFLLDMDSKEILVNTQGWDMARCEVAEQGVGLGDKRMLVQLKKAHEDFIGTLGGQLRPGDEVGS